MNGSNARERTPLSDATAAQIRAERAAAGLSQEALYTAAGIGRSTYLRLESGERVADVSQVAGICSALGLELPVFFERAVSRVAAKPPTLSEHVAAQLSPEAQEGIRKGRAIVAAEKAKKRQAPH